MAISSRLSVAVHILVLLATHKDKRITSEYMAGSINTNPVVVRRIMGQLNKAGLIATNPGMPGATILRPESDISLADVYRAVENTNDEQHLFSMHESPNPNCPVGRNIQTSLEGSFARAQSALEQELSKVSLGDIVMNIVQLNQL
jgi:DNA-binding IscR family transcriptional regulator